MKRNDIILAAILIVAGFFVSMFTYMASFGKEASYAVVSVNGEIMGEYSLNEDRTLSVDNEYGHNLIVIEDGNVYISESDCEGGDCIAMGHIHKTAERIVCLPHRLEIRIKGGESDVDTVAY